MVRVIFFLALVIVVKNHALTSKKLCPRTEFSARNGLKALKEESQLVPSLQNLFSGEWGQAVDFYLQQGVFKIPTGLSQELTKFQITVNSRESEEEILARFDPDYCRNENPPEKEASTEAITQSQIQTLPPPLASKPELKPQSNPANEQVPMTITKINEKLPGAGSTINLNEIFTNTASGANRDRNPTIEQASPPSKVESGVKTVDTNNQEVGSDVKPDSVISIPKKPTPKKPTPKKPTPKKPTPKKPTPQTPPNIRIIDGPESQLKPPEIANEEILSAAKKALGESSVEGPGGGRLSCVWMLNKILKRSVGYTIDTNSVTSMDNDFQGEISKGRAMQVSSLNEAQPGDIIVSPGGHVGVIAENRKIFSNSSSTKTWRQNFTYDSWKRDYVQAKGLKIKVYRILK